MRSIFKFSTIDSNKINWSLLLFFLLLLNVKMPLKIGALIVFLWLNRKLFREKWIYRQKFIWFYGVMIALAVINILLTLFYATPESLIAALVGISFWTICIGAAFLNQWFVFKTDTVKLKATIALFFFLNIAVTLVQLVIIMWDAGSINPYTYQGMYQKYFIGTGDWLTGITFDVSSTNALLNSFALVFFLSQKRYGPALLSMAIMLLTGSNFTTLITLLLLTSMFIFQSNRDQKSIISACFAMTALFMFRISPQNNGYVSESLKNIFEPHRKRGNHEKQISREDKWKYEFAFHYIDSLKKAGVRRVHERAGWTYSTDPSLTLIRRPVIPEPSIHTPFFQHRHDTTDFQQHLLAFARNIPSFTNELELATKANLPGKIIAFQQSWDFLRNYPWKIITGCGPGNFSSKLAFRTTGLSMAGTYPQDIVYIDSNFLNNHLCLYLSYFSQDTERHSFINSPASTYDQLITEYGLAGLTAFVLFYLLFFIRKTKVRSYSIPLLALLLLAFVADYWYEQLSVVIVFEFLMLLLIKESSPQHE